MKTKREKGLFVRLDDKEYLALLDLCRRKKASKSQTMRDLIKKRAVDKKMKEFEKMFEIYSEIYLDLSRVCGNINQIAHHLNTGNFIADPVLFFQQADKMKEIVNLFMQKTKEQQEILLEIL
ncbi:hypothetical protein HpCK38_15950 [Helicobacter pylori]